MLEVYFNNFACRQLFKWVLITCLQTRNSERLTERVLRTSRYPYDDELLLTTTGQTETEVMIKKQTKIMRRSTIMFSQIIFLFLIFFSKFSNLFYVTASRKRIVRNMTNYIIIVLYVHSRRKFLVLKIEFLNQELMLLKRKSTTLNVLALKVIL